MEIYVFFYSYRFLQYDLIGRLNKKSDKVIRAERKENPMNSPRFPPTWLINSKILFNSISSICKTSVLGNDNHTVIVILSVNVKFNSFWYPFLIRSPRIPSVPNSFVWISQVDDEQSAIQKNDFNIHLESLLSPSIEYYIYIYIYINIYQ